MGKASRRKKGAGNARSIKIQDASSVIDAFYSTSQMLGQQGKESAAHAIGKLEQWEQSPVMLRVDLDFALALADTNPDITVAEDWLDRMPYGAIGFSLPDPIVLTLHNRTFRFIGMVATGISVTADSTTHEPLQDAEGISCSWIVTVDGFPPPGAIPVLFLSRGEIVTGEKTLGDYIADATQRRDFDGDPAAAALITTLSLQLMLYLASAEPDVDWLPPASVARPHHMKDARIGHLGWRVGSAFRQISGSPSSSGISDGGWRMPPHIRRAHYRRVRVAMRDAAGKITGTRSGIEGVDWAYETRWIPPTPVNAENGVGPVVRDVTERAPV
ncbi:hypothetical protein Achl_4313 (plasmid) [Pseudarthrobacter chlorophenolicus A6]|uniref:Uncharacterized protein n=1 Tax=Pseudarthrobacter chlorophenolicus (strain ATCC 700700 / DSM 12829 / CIP 107037 / JCM 12360 / KCTC 9906 / NCIMB 13794 / A6) TaxID=452863 RepID=B8HIL7_PSECP|nr:hypothetical protein [Pseudarthrobacter chlorophenolicus]ACL42264.1 hypothetical protein Achl_4313 [Pseudarthrobacter chlorophenolicus A6]SDQ15654.1 hypothetical protein SAMN04489738_0371 [Pseudarthrobacter chlorophenolicus]